MQADNDASKESLAMHIDGPSKGKDRPKRTWKTIKVDMKNMQLIDRNEKIEFM